jgi:hypothetical protein
MKKTWKFEFKEEGTTDQEADCSSQGLQDVCHLSGICYQQP